MYLVRHGATHQNEQRPVVLQGNGINGPLSERGVQQAEEVGNLLSSKPLQAVYASPMQRAQQTAQQIADKHQLPIVTVPDLYEVNVGAWEGKTWTEIMETEREFYDRFMNDPHVPYRGGESFADVLGRIESPITELFNRHAGESFAVVAHNVVNRVYLASLIFGDLNRSRKVLQMNCCVNLIRHKGEHPEVVTVNNVQHLSNW